MSGPYQGQGYPGQRYAAPGQQYQPPQYQPPAPAGQQYAPPGQTPTPAQYQAPQGQAPQPYTGAPAYPVATPQATGAGALYQVRLTKVTSFLLMTRWQAATHTGTLEQLEAAYRSAKTHNLLAGWWGIPWGLIRTPIALSQNAYNIKQVRKQAAAAGMPRGGQPGYPPPGQPQYPGQQPPAPQYQAPQYQAPPPYPGQPR